MGWKESDRVSERKEFVRLSCLEGVNFLKLCERFGVSRKTGYKWVNRFRDQGEEGLSDQSRRPAISPARTSREMEKSVLELRDKHPAWGGRKLRTLLLKQGIAAPSASTITAILRRHGRLNDAASSKHKAWTRFQRSSPNELWQMDFKGEFKVATQQWCYPLTILDDHSRYSLGVQACENQRGETVKNRLRSVFARYGIPQAIYVDNGNPWGTPHRGFRHTRFSVWLMRNNIDVIHGQPHHPQGRGKLERFHRTLSLEVLQERNFLDHREVQSAFDPWRDIYNHQRPHESLEMRVPAAHYRTSDRSFKEQSKPWEYSSRFQTRKTNPHGQIQFQGQVYRVSEAFAGQRIGLCPTVEDGLWEVYYCRFLIGKLNQQDGSIERRQPVG